MSRPNINEIRQIGQFATYHRWNIQFTKLPNGSNISSDQLNLRALTSDVPGYTIENSEIMIRGHKVNQPSIKTYNGTVTMTFVEGVDAKILEFLANWAAQQWDPETGVQGQKQDYEAEIVMFQLNQQDEVIWTYKLIGCHIDGREIGGSLDGSNTDVIRPSVTIHYDYFVEGQSV
jgi:hypothetical protein